MPLNFRSFIYLPIIFFLLLPVGLFICYGIALTFNEVKPLPSWPYVSTLGANPPESNIFGFLFSWGAFIALLTTFFYYRYVLHHGHSTKLNVAALQVGCLTCFGMTLVGSFQVTTVTVIHWIGALIAFVSALIYNWLIVYISWKYMSRSGIGKGIIYFRLVLAIVESITFVLYVLPWNSFGKDPKELNNVRTISQWILTYGTFLSLASLIYEMNNIWKIQTRLILHSAPPDEEPNTNGLLLSQP